MMSEKSKHFVVKFRIKFYIPFILYSVSAVFTVFDYTFIIASI